MGTTGKKLFGVVLVALFLENWVEGAGLFGAPQALYGPEDDVVVLNAGNLNKTIYGTKNAWLVEFFSSWCGHCIHFAPIYKSFATEVKGWQKLVKVAGIDCADENNIPLCREYEIMGYPTILFFPPNSKEFKTDKEPKELYRGEPFTRADKVSQLKKELMDTLTPHFPSVLGDIKLLGVSVGGLWKSVKDAVSKDGSEKPSLLVLLYEKLSSTIGKELALAVSNLTQVRVLRFHEKNKLYNRFGMGTEWPAAGWIDENHKGAKFVIPKNANIVTSLENSIRKHLNLEVASVPTENKKIGEEIALNLKDGDKVEEEENNLEEPMLGGTSTTEDIVSLEDLIHAVRNSLRNEVGILKTLSEPKLTVLKQYVHVLGQLFPSDRREMIVFLMKLDKYLNTLSDTTLQVNDYLDKLTELELELHPWDIDVNSWGTCRGSLPGRRGYTCSLWRLFHTLTILSAQKAEPLPVLPVIHGYVREFFGCSECVSHFTKMVADEGALTITSVRSQALWLWRAHNKVNLRLKGTTSEDPAYPKISYPSEAQCSDCHTTEGSYNEEKVFEYLVKVYTHPARTTQSTGPKKRESKWENGGDGKDPVASKQQQYSKNRHQISSRFFSGTDYWIFCIVYLSVASLLIFGYYHFKLGSRRRLDPFAVCRKFVNSARSLG